MYIVDCSGTIYATLIQVQNASSWNASASKRARFSTKCWRDYIPTKASKTFF